ncbi:peptidoglycan endopeptidase [Lysobacter pythonis]|uniref:Peptidoglycan endopeptidase n=1 Tax=Solilutibacter pythonis TaxID=2483112 RepID=A0A3M2HT57_9GAMM|nr:C40 family peptidase [Lysobacter pythonis]RMH92936.1 peptidoglycan endopeptidase [Lysobacter pythonis]
MTAHYPGSMQATPARHPCLGLLPLLLILAAPASPAAENGPAATPGTGVTLDRAMLANAVLMRAISLVGTPYVWGGNTPESGFDCSGLVNYVFRDMLDLRLPRTSRELSALAAPAVDDTGLATGDLVFFASGGVVTHVGIYVGDGRFIHAPRTGGTVRMEQLDGRYWQARYAGARRVLASLK